MYVNGGVKNYLKEDHRTCIRNLCSCKKKAWKNIYMYLNNSSLRNSHIYDFHVFTTYSQLAYRRGQGFEFRTSLNFFQAFFSSFLFYPYLGVSNTPYLGSDVKVLHLLLVVRGRVIQCVTVGCGLHVDCVCWVVAEDPIGGWASLLFLVLRAISALFFSLWKRNTVQRPNFCLNQRVFCSLIYIEPALNSREECNKFVDLLFRVYLLCLLNGSAPVTPARCILFKFIVLLIHTAPHLYVFHTFYFTPILSHI